MQLTYLSKTLRFIWHRGKAWILLSVLFAILQGLIPITILWVSKETINAVAELVQSSSKDYSGVLLLLILQFLVTFFSSCLINFQDYYNQKFEVGFTHNIQKLLLQKSSTVPLSYYDMPEFYNHLDRAQEGLGSRLLAPVQNLMNIGKLIISITSLLVYLFSVHWILVLFSLITAFPIFWIQSNFGKRRFWMSFTQTPLAREAAYTSYLLQDRQTAKEIRLFGLARLLIDRWSSTYLRNALERLTLVRKQQAADVGLDTMTALFYLGCALIMVWLIRKTSIPVGDFIAIGQAVQNIQSSINQTANLMAKMYEDNLYLRDFFHFIEFEDPTRGHQSESGSLPLPLQKGIRFDNVSFRYMESERDVLQNVSFCIKPGERVAIVGANGSGKTTLVKCLMGLYPVTGGRILFDDCPLESIKTNDLYKRIAVIFQDFVRYSYSVRDNITFGDVSRIHDEERMRQVSQKSGVFSFVENFTSGYDTPLGKMFDGSEDLSGGQWQKIALARALFRDSEVVILDEPTAALDPMAEMEVFEQFDQMTHNKTTIFISHRMSAARLADRIFVMKNGRLIESGKHEELILLGGEYCAMYGMQAKWYAEPTMA